MDTMATTSSTSREIRVQAAGDGTGTGTGTGTGGGEHVVTRLSDLDHLMPKLYVHMIEVFRLPADADRQQIVSNLARGLSLTLRDYPFLAGTLHFDNEARRIVVKTAARDASVGLYVREPGPGPGPGADGDVGVASFAELDRRDFSVHLFDPSKVLPAPFVGTVPVPADDLAAEGPAVCGLQVTFIEGGAVLALAATHQVCDGPGCEGLLTSWARYARAVAGGDPSGGAAPPEAERPGRDILTHEGAPLSRAAWAELGERFPTNKTPEGPPAPPPADFTPPVVKSRIWHFPRSRLAELKRLCSEGGGEGGGRVSTYDALLAVLWRALVRAKQPLLRAPPDAPSKAVHAVNARGRAAPAIPGGYLGVGVTMPQSPRLTVADVLAPDAAAALPRLARTVRAATACVTPGYVADLARFAANAPDLRWTELDMHWFLGLDCMVFSWHNMKSYHTHDFGFGAPAALRWPSPQFEGFCFVLPTRIAKGNDDEGWEVCLGLEESCYPRFEADEELLRFGEQRGA